MCKKQSAWHRTGQHVGMAQKAACWLCAVNSRPLAAQRSRFFVGQRPGCHGVGAQKKSGIPCGLQRLSYAGKHMDDSQRTLEQCGNMSCTYGTLMLFSGSRTRLDGFAKAILCTLSCSCLRVRTCLLSSAGTCSGYDH